MFFAYFRRNSLIVSSQCNTKLILIYKLYLLKSKIYKIIKLNCKSTQVVEIYTKIVSELITGNIEHYLYVCTYICF